MLIPVVRCCPNRQTDSETVAVVVVDSDPDHTFGAVEVVGSVVIVGSAVTVVVAVVVVMDVVLFADLELSTVLFDFAVVQSLKFVVAVVGIVMLEVG